MNIFAMEGRGTAELTRALAASEERFRAIVDRSADGIMVLAADGLIRFVNPAAVTLLGRSAEELLDHPFGIPLVPGDTTEIDMLPRGRAAGVAELRVVETEWEGRPAFLATLREITEHKLAEQKACEAVRRRDEFLAMLSHELRNPLAAIAGAAEIVCRAHPEDERLCAARQVIDRQCRQMTRLLDDLLDVTRLSHGRIQLRVESLDFRSVVAEVLDTISPAAAERGHHLDVSFCEQPLVVNGDSPRLNQVVMNLMTNAVRYTEPNGRIDVQVVQEAESAVLRVRDNGIGIPCEMLESIFEPFVQTPQTRTRLDAGLGVGLALVRNLVELHGGRVVANSRGPGQGCEFTVTLPLATQPATPHVVPEPSDHPKGLRITIVEDNPDVREMLVALLSLEGHTVQSVTDGQRAVAALSEERPDVALIDIGLPLLDGYEVAKRLRANPATADLYLIALTGYGQPEDRRRALESGFDTHLTKPVEVERLLRLLGAKHGPRA